MKPLSEKELSKLITNYRIKCDIHVSDRDEGAMTQEDYENSIQWELDKVIEAILSDRKAWGEYVIGEDQKYMTRQFPQSEKFLKNAAIRIENELRAEQRQRNQGEKTDE